MKVKRANVGKENISLSPSRPLSEADRITFRLLLLPLPPKSLHTQHKDFVFFVNMIIIKSNNTPNC